MEEEELGVAGGYEAGDVVVEKLVDALEVPGGSAPVRRGGQPIVLPRGVGCSLMGMRGGRSVGGSE